MNAWAKMLQKKMYISKPAYPASCHILLDTSDLLCKQSLPKGLILKSMDLQVGL